MQFLLRSGVLATSERFKRLHSAAAKLSHHELPKCAACSFGRQTNRPVPHGRKSKAIKEKVGILSANQTEPGQRVFIDHFVSSTRGRRIKGYGIREPSGQSPARTNEGHSGGCVFIDASTSFIHIEFQSHLSSHETIQATQSFEQLSLDNGVVINQCFSDNGSAFTSKAFRDHLEQQGQVQLHSGAGSHHMNGKAERAIRTIMAMARVMMLHSAVHWPDVSDPTLWPLAVKHAVWIHNRLPQPSTGLSPIDLWTKQRFPL